jgi:hypothetical protein
MEFRVLGPLEIRDGDRSLALAGAKQRAPLALAALEGEPGRLAGAADRRTLGRAAARHGGDEPPGLLVAFTHKLLPLRRC